MNLADLNRKLRFFPSLTSQKGSALFFDDKDLIMHKNSELIGKENVLKQVRLNLLRDLLCDDNYFSVMESIFNKNNSIIPIYYFGDKHNIEDKKSYTKEEIVRLANKAIEDNLLNLDEAGVKRLKYLNDKVSYNSFLKKYEDKTFEIYIEDNKYNFEIKDFINVINMSKEDFASFFAKDELIGGVSKREYAYALEEFLSIERVFDCYMMPEETISRFNELCSYELIDFESVNNILDSEAYLYEEAILQDELKQYLFEGMPKDLPNIEKAIYLYIKACKLLSYDEEFYLSNQKGMAALKHQDINNLSKINLSNKKIVCYEFTAIYGKLLEELGINFEVDNAITNEYGFGHNKLIFKQDEYMVEADSVTTIFQGDLIRVKTNYPPVGIKCLNASEKTCDNFKKKVAKINSMIKIDEMEFDDALAKYENIMIDRENILFEDKLKLYIDKISRCGMKLGGMDSLGYAFLLSKTIFNKEERTNNINFGIFKVVDDSKEIAKLVISINKKGFNFKENNKYLIYDLDGTLSEISKMDLNKLIKNKSFHAVDQNKSKVPGLGD